jgi:uroporphyrinogen-III synthase
VFNECTGGKIVPNSLQGQTIALAEGRQLEELAQMLEKEGANTLRCPMVSILDAPDEEAVMAWLRELIADQFRIVVLMTGEGVRRLLGVADRAGLRTDVIAALGRTRMITRGPKPVKALKEIGLTPSQIAAAPTTEGVIATLQSQSLRGERVGVQLFGAPNPALEKFLIDGGALVASVLPYIYAPSVDTARVVDLIDRMARGQIAAIVFTSKPQVDRLYQVASDQQRETELKNAWAKTRVAAVGPVVAESLRQRGAPVHICPEQGFVMKNLVKHIKSAFAGE